MKLKDKVALITGGAQDAEAFSTSSLDFLRRAGQSFFVNVTNDDVGTFFRHC